MSIKWKGEIWQIYKKVEWPMTDLIEEMEYVFQPKDEAHAYFEEFESYKQSY